MELLAALCSLVALVVTWWALNKLAKKRGWKWWQRHPAGAIAGFAAMLVITVAGMPPTATAPSVASEIASSLENGSESARAALTVANTESKAAPTDNDDTYPAVKAGTTTEIQALAEESLKFMTAAKRTIDFAVAASDGEAIRDEVERPSWKMIMRWNAYTYGSYHAYEACYDALQAMNSYAARLVQTDSADRRRSLDYNAEQYDAKLPKCELTVESKGRISSDDE